ncbi:chromate transporter [Ramlibacter sp.]|uniref:chromate transporter n=1 Tax=Ramlibacter sp. TaxID=1917967 RepID=UPI003D0C15E2
MTSPPADAEPRAKPRSLTELFLAFNWMALQGFGGVLVVVQRELVDRKKWFTREEFVEEWAVAQIMPGPNVVNLGIMYGARHFGWRGSFAAVAGLLGLPALIVVLLALVYTRYQSDPHVSGALRGMGAIAAGMFMATGVRLIPALKKNVLRPALAGAFAIAAFVAIALLRVPLAWVLLGIGGLACVIAWRRLR